MSSETDPIWDAVLAAEDQHGEGAEHYARAEAEKATASGDMLQAAIWDAAAHTLHVLHSINRTWAKPRAASPRPGTDLSGTSTDAQS
ncbi:MAG: hypothetical protein Q7T68_12980 [Sphingopyxis sp.]|nr:hypothetical protein [Sphingopyxis sp.]